MITLLPKLCVLLQSHYCLKPINRYVCHQKLRGEVTSGKRAQRENGEVRLVARNDVTRDQQGIYQACRPPGSHHSQGTDRSDLHNPGWALPTNQSSTGRWPTQSSFSRHHRATTTQQKTIKSNTRRKRTTQFNRRLLHSLSSIYGIFSVENKESFFKFFSVKYGRGTLVYYTNSSVHDLSDQATNDTVLPREVILHVW